MAPTDLIQTYRLTDPRINRALHLVQPKTVAAYVGRVFRWLSRKLEVAYRLGASEDRLKASEGANDY